MTLGAISTTESNYNYSMTEPNLNERNIEKYLDDLEYFLDLIEENLDFKIKDVLNRRQIKRKHGITVESEQEKAALAMYKVACKLAKDWESFWCRRD
mgnify:CR=1 FL=1